MKETGFMQGLDTPRTLNPDIYDVVWFETREQADLFTAIAKYIESTDVFVEGVNLTFIDDGPTRHGAAVVVSK